MKFSEAKAKGKLPRSDFYRNEYKPTALMAATSRYDEDRADKVMHFITTYCKHSVGEWRGKPFIPLPWQEQILRDVFGTIKPDGTRQFRDVYVEIPKKNGKSTLAAAVALYLMCADGEGSAEIYGCANDQQQAGIIFREAVKMVRQDEVLRSNLKINNSEMRIYDERSFSFYQALSSDVTTKQGFNTHGLVFDELFALKNRELYDTMTQYAGSARRQPLNFITTTAGNDRHNVCWEVRTKAERVLNGGFIDNGFYPVIYGISEGDDWREESSWLKANPSMGETSDYPLKLNDMRRDAANASLSLPAQNNFRQFRLNEWVKQTTRWIDMYTYERNSVPISRVSLRGRKCYGGLDLSWTTDLSAFVLAFPPDPSDENDRWVILPWFFLPREGIEQKEHEDNAPYRSWEREGYVTPTEGAVIDYVEVQTQIERAAKEYDVRAIGYDPAGARELTQLLTRKGINMVEVRQGWLTMSPAISEFERLIRQEKINHLGNPVLRWNFDNAQVKTDSNGNKKLEKNKQTGRIDGAIASIIAVKTAELMSGVEEREEITVENLGDYVGFW